MLKVLHTDKAQVALGYSTNSADRELEDTEVAEEFRSLLSNARRKGAQVAACESVDAISLAMAVQSIATRPPSAVEQPEKASNYQASDVADDGEFAQLSASEDGAINARYSDASGRGDDSASSNQSYDSASEETFDSTAERPRTESQDTAAATEASPEGSVKASDTTEEKGVNAAPSAVEQWANEVSSDVEDVLQSKASEEGSEVILEDTSTSEQLPEQVSIKQARPEMRDPSAAPGLARVGPEELGNEHLQKPVEDTERSLIAEATDSSSAVKVNIQPQVIKDPEIIPFIVDNPASMLKRTNEVSAQMMMLRQAFESLRTGSSREAGLGIGTTGAPAGGGNLGSGAAGGAFKGAPNDPSAVREKTQQPLSRSATYRLLERVNATLKEAARARDGKTISLHLEPVDLGRIKVDVSLKDGALHARLTPESAQVGQALREHAHELQAALRKLGLDVEKVTVNVSADAQGKEFSPEQQNLGDGKGFQDNRNNMPHGAGQLAENTFGNELADRGEQVGEQVEVALKEAKTSSALSWRDNWVA